MYICCVLFVPTVVVGFFGQYFNAAFTLYMFIFINDIIHKKSYVLRHNATVVAW